MLNEDAILRSYTMTTMIRAAGAEDHAGVADCVSAIDTLDQIDAGIRRDLAEM